jgi:cobalt-zinc-cadmium efflux system outer membrane protein
LLSAVLRGREEVFMKSHPILYLALACALFPSWAAGASDESPPALTLDRCIDIALAQNPLWLSSEDDYQASLARVRQAKAFAQPALQWDSDLEPKPLSFGRSAESYFGVSQFLEFPGKRLLRGKIATLESKEVLADQHLLKLELEYQVKEAFYGVLLALERRTYAGQDLDLARDFVEKAEAKFQAGDVARMEVLRAGVEASKAATALKLAESDVLLAKARLNYFLGREKFEPLEVKGDLVREPVPIDVEALRSRALGSRPELAKIRARLDGESKKKAWGIMSYLPDFDLGFSRHRLAGEPSTWDFTLTITVPLFFWQPARGEIAEAQANLRSLGKQRQDLVNRVSLEVQQACLNAEAAAGQIAMFKDEVLTQAEDVYNLVLFSFQEGETSGIELIEARRTLIESRQAYADALYNYSVTLAELEKSIGGPLEGVGNVPKTNP